jgi:glycosyltransferase involved in cell wall biosynthesis
MNVFNETDKEIALFTHNFLEPNHYAIAQVLSGLKEYNYHVFAKRFINDTCFQIPNIKQRTFYTKGVIKVPFNPIFIHAIYDGKTAIRAGKIAESKRIPFLLSFHGGFDTNAKIFDPRYVTKTIELVQKATEVTVTNQFDIKRLELIGVKRDINIIPVPIDVKILPNKNYIRNPFNLLLVGRLIPKKGIDVALKTMAILPTNYTLNIIGCGELEKELRNFASSLNLDNRVKWLGELKLSDTLSELNKSGILIHPSRVAEDGNADGTPQIILYAQALGVPVVTTDTGSILSIVTNGETGIIVSPDSIFQTYEAIIKLSDGQLSSFLANNAETKVKQKHSIDLILEKWRNLYLKLFQIAKSDSLYNV